MRWMAYSCSYGNWREYQRWARVLPRILLLTQSFGREVQSLWKEETHWWRNMNVGPWLLQCPAVYSANVAQEMHVCLRKLERNWICFIVVKSSNTIYLWLVFWLHIYRELNGSNSLNPCADMHKNAWIFFS